MLEEVETSKHNLKHRVMLQGKKIKDHIEKNKWIYVGSGIIVILSRGYFKPNTMNAAEIMTHIRPVGVLSKQNVITNITKVYSPGRGRPGNLVGLVGRPDIAYGSQTKAARIFGVSDKTMSLHLDRKIPMLDVGGNSYQLTRLGV